MAIKLILIVAINSLLALSGRVESGDKSGDKIIERVAMNLE